MARNAISSNLAQLTYYKGPLSNSIGAVLRARKRTRVTVSEFHVSLYPISVSPFFPLYMLNV